MVSKETQPEPKLNPTAKEFKPKLKAIIGTASVSERIAVPVPALNPAAKKYNPKPEDSLSEESKIKSEEEKTKVIFEKKISKLYTLEFLLQFKTKCAKRPKDMRPIEMPTKSKKDVQYMPYDQAQEAESKETIRNLRILLNKLSKENYARIYDTALNNFTYTSEVLEKLAKMLYNKCVKEQRYVDLYMGLIEQLFLKFKKGPKKAGEMVDKPELQPEGELLDFKMMFLEFCQGTFDNPENDNFIHGLPDKIDDEERKILLKQYTSGNITLIGELLNRGAIPDKIVKECLDKLISGNNQEVEHACILLKTIGGRLYEYYAFEAQLTTLPRKPKVRVKMLTKEIFDEILDKMVALKMSEKMSAEVKANIQEVIEARDKIWNMAFNQFPIPKTGKMGDVVAYRKKAKSIEQQDVPVVSAPINPFPIDPSLIPPDPELEKHEANRIKLNEVNIFGRSIQKYSKRNMEQKIRMKIYNLADEYLLSSDITALKEGVQEIRDIDMLQKCLIIGHIILYSFGKAHKEMSKIWKSLEELIILKAIQKEEIEEGVIVALANFFDTVIDLPDAPNMLKELLMDYAKKGIIEAIFEEKCRKHLEEVQKEVTEEYNKA